MMVEPFSLGEYGFMSIQAVSEYISSDDETDDDLPLIRRVDKKGKRETEGRCVGSLGWVTIGLIWNGQRR